jgi:hypothetical protein
MPSPHQPILDAFVRLRAAWPHRGWSFDNRFECVASSFEADFAPTARTLIAPSFPHGFSDKTLHGASSAIRAAAERTGGVRAAQLIFGGDPIGRLTPYALWWPWEEAQTISLRVGIEGATSQQLDELCTCFGAER